MRFHLQSTDKNVTFAIFFYSLLYRIGTRIQDLSVEKAKTLAVNRKSGILLFLSVER